MARRGFVSVVVVTRDRRDDLRMCLRSVFAQTHGDIEAVVVDNASSDGTEDMVRRDFPRARLLRQYRNTGCPGGRNIGARAASGEYVFFLDDDAALEETAVEEAVGFLRPRGDFAAVGIAVVPHPDTPSVQCAFDPERLGHRPRLYPNFSGGASLVRRDAFLRHSGFRSEFVYGGEERELALRMMLSGHFVAYLPTVRMFHRRSPGGQRDEADRLRSGLRNDLFFIWAYDPIPMALAATAKKLVYYTGFAHSKGCLGQVAGDLFLAPATSASIALSGQRRRVGYSFLVLLKALEVFTVPPDHAGWKRALHWAARKTS